jgi:hypothetical protein
MQKLSTMPGPLCMDCGEHVVLVEGIEKGSWCPVRCGCGCWHSACYFTANKIVCMDCGKEVKP